MTPSRDWYVILVTSPKGVTKYYGGEIKTTYKLKETKVKGHYRVSSRMRIEKPMISSVYVHFMGQCAAEKIAKSLAKMPRFKDYTIVVDKAEPELTKHFGALCEPTCLIESAIVNIKKEYI